VIAKGYGPGRNKRVASRNSFCNTRIWLRLFRCARNERAGRLRTHYRLAKQDAQRGRDHKAALEAENTGLRLQASANDAISRKFWTISSSLSFKARSDGVLMDVNPAWTVSLGWTEQDLIGCNFFDLIHPADFSEAIRGAGSLLNGSGPGRFTSRCRHKTGGHRWISWVAVRSDAMLIATGHELTAEKELTASLETAQSALRQSMKMEAIGQLTGGLAHDFNNLLVVITGNLELLQTRLDQGQTANLGPYILSAQAAAKRAAALTHRLLAFSRRQSLDPVPVNLNEVLSKWRI